MSDPLLTTASRERLEMLAEEAAEVIKAVTKILRHGWESYNPDVEDSPTNREELSREIKDFCAVAHEMSMNCEIEGFPDLGATPEDNQMAIDGWGRHWQEKKLKWTHHQGGHATASFDIETSPFSLEDAIKSAKIELRAVTTEERKRP